VQEGASASLLGTLQQCHGLKQIDKPR